MTDMWDRVAGSWERHAEWIEEHMAAATSALLDAAGVAPGAAVLDVAAGAGGAGLAAADRLGGDGSVTMVDRATEMVAAARRRADGRPSIVAEVGDQHELPFPAEAFDAVICRHGLMFAPDPNLPVVEAARVLKPGGRYAAAVWDDRAENPWLAVLLDAAGAELGFEVPPPGVPGPFSLDDPERLTAALVGGGLTDVQVQRHDAPAVLASAEEWWDLVPSLAGPFATLLPQLEPDVQAAIRRRALEGIRAVAQPGPDGRIVVGGSVLVGAGRVG